MCGLGDLATSPEAARSYLHEDEFGAQGGHVWKLLSEAQHHPAVGEPALVVVEVLQLCKDTRREGGCLQLLGAFTPELTHAASPTLPGPLLQEASRSPQARRQEGCATSSWLEEGEKQRALEHREGFPGSAAGSLTD